MAFGLRSKTFILKPFLRILDAMGLPMLPTPMNPTETAMVSSFARGRKEDQRFPLPETGPSIAPDSREVHRAPGHEADVSGADRSPTGTASLPRAVLPREERRGARADARAQW